MSACINMIRDGATDYEVAAEYMRASTLAGSEPTGFGPFIRPTTRLGEEHTTWRGEIFRNGDAVFLENAASYRKSWSWCISAARRRVLKNRQS